MRPPPPPPPSPPPPPPPPRNPPLSERYMWFPKSRVAFWGRFSTDDTLACMLGSGPYVNAN